MKTNQLKKFRQFKLDLFTLLEKAKQDLSLFDYIMNNDMYESTYNGALLFIQRNNTKDTAYNIGDCIFYAIGENTGLKKGCKYSFIEFSLIFALNKYFYMDFKSIEQYLNK